MARETVVLNTYTITIDNRKLLTEILRPNKYMIYTL